MFVSILSGHHSFHSKDKTVVTIQTNVNYLRFQNKTQHIKWVISFSAQSLLNSSFQRLLVAEYNP